jgi:SpoVK/Ycf46/Vps4 family AAA+-type ATPase
MPLSQMDLALKHAVVPPRPIIFFGRPGTGKTLFVKAIAAVLQWWFIEASPSTLMADGEDRLGANLKNLMKRARDLENTVLFFDEFEELAHRRGHASQIEKSITNEFLKQVPMWKDRPRQNLLVCATNYIRHLDAALLRPGRFDCVIPVGSLDDQSRRRIFEHFLADTNRSEVDVDRIISEIPLFTLAEIEYLFLKVQQEAFEQECVQGEDYRVTTTMFLKVIPTIRQTLDGEIVEAFQQDCAEFTRY